MMNAKLIIIFFIISVCLFSFNCGKKKSSNKYIPPPQEIASDGGIIVIGALGDIGDLNPLTSHTNDADEIIKQIFMSLVERDEELKVVPSIAESWEFSPDFLELTYFLRKGILWSDGKQLTADDVVYSYQMFTHPDVKFRTISQFEFIKDIKKVDDYTVQVLFKEIYAEELAQSGSFEILPKHILDKTPPKDLPTSDFKYRPLGCGPFKLDKWDLGTEWSLIPNEFYYKGRPHLDKVVYRVMPDDASRLTALKTSEIDVAPIGVENYNEIKKYPHLKIIKIPQRGYTYIGWNLRNPLFKSKKVRQALTFAINREEIIEKYLFGFGKIAVSPILCSSWAYNSSITPFAYNVEKAKKLLAEEGWLDINNDGWLEWNGKDEGNESTTDYLKKGQRFSFTMTTSSANSLRSNIVIYAQEQYRKIGIEVIPNLVDGNTLIDMVANKRKFDSVVLGWALDLSINPKQTWHSSMADVKGSSNFIGFSNATVDSLIDIGRKTLDTKRAKLIWDKFQEIIYNEQPYTFLFIPEKITGVNKRIRDVENADIRGLYQNMRLWWIPIEERKKNETVINSP